MTISTVYTLSGSIQAVDVSLNVLMFILFSRLFSLSTVCACSYSWILLSILSVDKSCEHCSNDRLPLLTVVGIPLLTWNSYMEEKFDDVQWTHPLCLTIGNHQGCYFVSAVRNLLKSILILTAVVFSHCVKMSMVFDDLGDGNFAWLKSLCPNLCEVIG